MDLSRVLLYCIVCSDTSGDYVHKYIGKEPSGGSAEALTLKDSLYSFHYHLHYLFVEVLYSSCILLWYQNWRSSFGMIVDNMEQISVNFTCRNIKTLSDHFVLISDYTYQRCRITHCLWLVEWRSLLSWSQLTASPSGSNTSLERFRGE